MAYLLRGHPGHWARVEPDKLSTLTWPAQGPGGPYGPIKQEFGPPPELPPVVAWIGTGNNPIPVYADPSVAPAEVRVVCSDCRRAKGCNADCEDMNCDHCYCYRDGRDG